jgi:phenylpropionate dioxygenase-like ring-hydroxylating dioxygenase large terminal subunit
MIAKISAKEYFDSNTFKVEQKEIFEKVWHYVGTVNDFENINDFKTIVIAGIPVVIQNCKGIIKCFRNVCSHRHSIIQSEKCGNRALMCPYHGWAYNEKGLPIGIPKKPLFEFEENELDNLKLQEFNIEFCGNFVFVKLSTDMDNSLKQFLGGFYTELEEISLNLGDLIDTNEMVIKANWKILVENTLESYHVNLVHKDTFQRLGAKGLNFDFFGDHSSWSAELNSKELDGKQSKIYAPFVNRGYKIDGYKHILIFPNTLVSTTYGASFNISQILPLNETESLFISYVFVTKKNDNDNEALESIFKSSLVQFNRSVFEEDKVICEKVQIGAQSSPFTGVLSEEEQRVCQFQKTYINYINSKL